MEYILEKSYDEFISRHEGINFHFDGQSAKLVVLRKNIDDELIEIFNFDKVFFQLFFSEYGKIRLNLHRFRNKFKEMYY